MLRSTGFFRGIDCPFYCETNKGKAGSDGCSRPYCHFRHSKQRRASSGIYDTGKSKALSAKTTDQGYDPFSPEVVRPGEHYNGEPPSVSAGPDVDLGTMELELVNKAIEAVRSEMEKDKKKLSQIGDQEYEPTTSSVKRQRPTAASSHQSYNPGSYQMGQATEYNPTPRSSKYTLDSENSSNNANALEYVPTVVSKKSVKKTLPPTSSCVLPTRIAKTSSISVKCKYTLDNCKPSTDMEYDPLSNYSAKPAVKEQRTLGSEGEAKRRFYPTEKEENEEYVPTAKKPKSSTPKVDVPKYSASFSESDEESSGMEYRPTSLSRLQRKGINAALKRKRVSGDRNAGALRKQVSKTEEDFSPSGSDDIESQGTLGSEGESKRRFYPTENEENEEYVPTAKKPKSSKPKVDVPKYSASFSESDDESSGMEYRPTSLSRLQRKGINPALKRGRASGDSIARALRKQVSKTEEDFSPSESDDIESQDKDRMNKKTEEKNTTGKSSQSKSSKSDKLKKNEKDLSKKSSSQKERRESASGDKTSKSLSKDCVKKEKIQGKHLEGSSKSKDRSSEKMQKDGIKVKSSDEKNKKLEKVKGDHTRKDKDRESSDAKKGKMDKHAKSDKIKDLKNGRYENNNREKDKKMSSSSKEKSKKSNSDKKVQGKTKDRSLSHVDLFGDESANEEDDEEDERIVRKSASAFKLGSLMNNKRKASEVACSTEDDSDDDGGDDDDDDAVDYSSLQAEMDCDSDPMEECLRIFNESKEVKTEDKGRQAKQPSKEQLEEDDETESTLTTLFPGQKKRVSHFKTQGISEASPSAAPMPQRRRTAQEICYQRMQKAQQQAAQLAAAVKSASAPTNPILGLSGEKRRVAHRPNASLPSPKPGLSDSSSRVLSPTRTATDRLSIKSHTSASILSKTMSTAAQKRVAHTPTMKSSTMKRPIIPAEFGAKVPTNVRQRYLTIFIDECLKICSSEEEAFQMALEEEKVVYDRSSSKNIYLNVAVNTLKKLRSKSTPVSPATKTPPVSVNRKAQSHEEVLGGRLAATTSYTINRSGKPQDVNFKGAILYEKLSKYVMTEEQLQEHGYPSPHPEIPGYAVVHNLPEKKNSDPFSKVCCRCGAEYKINANGSCVRKEECIFHWGRLRRNRVPGGWETLYNCCSGAVGSPGCEVAKQHVQDGRKESLDGFVKTFSKPLPVDGNGGVYALDCEMCYTKQGLELTRVTVINSDFRVVYDTFVKPASKVVDYNTRFSGVTQDDLENTTITLRDVQAVLLSMFSAESILMGHSLESDLFALKLIHSTVVDTAIVFPHRLGLPYKRALRNLMSDYLKRIIQDSVEGHDSSEDARACMELMIWKLKEDAKVKR